MTKRLPHLEHIHVLDLRACAECHTLTPVQEIRRGLCEGCALFDCVDALRCDIESQPYRARRMA